MLASQQQYFLRDFFKFNNPQSITTTFTEEQFRSNDMKISLQIATKSYLRMQSDPKTGLVSFSCKNYGKACYQIFGFRNNSQYLIETDYTQIKHAKCCQLKNENFEYLKIYNLMKLKKDLIDEFMVKNDLTNASPSEILSSISQRHQYFFQELINYNPQLRRKLRKRFDNIINIDIKKITKGGRDQMEFIQKDASEIFKERKNCQDLDNMEKKQEPNGQKKGFTKYVPKQKLIKKAQKQKKKQSLKMKGKQKEPIFQTEEKQNIFFNGFQPQNNGSQTFLNQFFKSIEDPIYISSESQLPEIKQLNSGCSYFEDVFSRSEEEKQVIQIETINDKLRQTVLMGMRKNNKF